MKHYIVEMTPETINKLRFGYSPLIELAVSYLSLKVNDYPQWTAAALPNMPDFPLDYMDSVILSAPSFYLANFLTPTPDGPVRDIESEFARIRDLPAEVIRADIQFAIDLDGMTPIREHFMTYPHEAMVCLIEEARLYWERVLAPHWPRILSILENDVLHHGRMQALNGSLAMLPKLSTQLSIQPSGMELMLNTKCDSWGRRFKPGDTEVRLVPIVLLRDRVMQQFVPHWGPMIVYSARGAGLWRSPEMPEPERELVTLLGEGRARVLMAVTNPATTTDLAHRLGVTAGAVSQHLSKLSQAGLVEQHRVGHRVFYRLSMRGEAMLALFEATSVPLAITG